jgi:hypothetical protein
MHKARTWKVKAGINALEFDKNVQLEEYDPREQKRIMEDCVMRLSGDPADNPDDQYHGEDWKLDPEPLPPWVEIVRAMKRKVLQEKEIQAIKQAATLNGSSRHTGAMGSDTA